LFSTLAGAEPMPAATQPSMPEGITFRIIPARREYVRWDRFDVLVRIENHSDETYILYDIGGGERDPSYDAEVDKGERTIPQPKTLQASDLSFVKVGAIVLPPRHVLEEIVCVSAICDMTNMARYRVRLITTVYSQKEQDKPLRLVSNRLEGSFVPSRVNRPVPRPIDGPAGRETGSNGRDH
jgi:hypothetical protein